MRHHVFAYGSLMFPQVWRRVVCGRPAARPARLHGFERLTVRGETYPAIVERAKAWVDGVVYLDVQAGDLQRLDAFEGADYERRALRVRLLDGAGDGLAAQAYVWTDPSRLEDCSWDPDWFGRDGLPVFLATYCRVRGVSG